MDLKRAELDILVSAENKLVRYVSIISYQPRQNYSDTSDHWDTEDIPRTFGIWWGGLSHRQSIKHKN